MGWSEVLKVIPKLDPQALSAMDNSLSQRFGKIAKKFGKGLLSALTGGGVLGIATSLIDKFLNPLKEVQEAIDRTLNHADDVVTNAQQFGSTPGELLRLQAFAQSKGLPAEQLFTMLQKFQTSIAEAKQDPTKATSVRLFANESNIVTAFEEFIQGLQKLNPNQRVLVQQEVFGEKAILKMANFLQADFTKAARLMGGPDEATLSRRARRGAALNAIKQRLGAATELEDFSNKLRAPESGGISNEMIRLQDEQKRRDLKFENKDIANYENLAALAKTADEIKGIAKDAFNWVSGIFPKVQEGIDAVKRLADSPLARGIIKWMPGGK